MLLVKFQRCHLALNYRFSARKLNHWWLSGVEARWLSGVEARWLSGVEARWLSGVEARILIVTCIPACRQQMKLIRIT